MTSQAQRLRRNAFTAGLPNHRFLLPTDSYLPKGRKRRSFRYTLSEDDRKLDELDRDRDEHGLTPRQVDAFREVFNLFDINGGGTIDADELDAALKAVEIHLTHQEIQDVLQVIDEDGNGEIDFNEFLTLMTSTERFLENLRVGGEKDTHKESLLFTALTKFMKKSALSSLSEIERYYHSKMRKSPHVVGHYAAGARLIGLTEKQMEKHMATLSVTGDKDNNSPYAQPLCMFTTNIPTNILGKRRTHGKIRLTIVKKKNGEEEEEEGPCNYKEGESNSSVHPMPNINSPTCKKPASAPVIPSYKRSLHRSPKSPLRLQATSSVPLPAVSVKKVQKDPNLLTIEDLPVIRERVQTAYKNYRRKQDGMREEMVHNSTFTDLGAIPSRTLQIQFKYILEAYSFSPTNVPPGLELQQLQPWHLVY